jgi:proteasome lid subunit RPN8/RPN11
MSSKIIIPREMFEMILESAKRLHPKESILLLRGKVKHDFISVSDVIIPPLATYGRGFSGFPTHLLPMDFSIVGTAHSHPSGNIRPSVGDLNHSMGRVMLIVGFPYQGIENAAAYDRRGEKVTVELA